MKISFCIVCMNRLHQLRQTLTDNMTNNLSGNDIEFLLLDYNSQDGMEEWVKENFTDLINSGVMTYYRTNLPQVFSHSHSKNLAFKLASGDLVCNVNADHYLGYDFIGYIKTMFNHDRQIVLTPLDISGTNNEYMLPGDVGGKVCLHKSDFLAVGGFDEKMSIYGFEDLDFITRLNFYGLKPVNIRSSDFLRFIQHEDYTRHSSDNVSDKIENIYISYRDPSYSDILILYIDGSFEMGGIVDNIVLHAEEQASSCQPASPHFLFSKDIDSWLTGKWNKVYYSSDRYSSTAANENNAYKFYAGNEFYLMFSTEEGDSVLTDKTLDKKFYRLNDPVTEREIIAFNSVYTNRTIYEENLSAGRIKVNLNGFGESIIYKNFDYANPISVN